jgi:hypothetical protein
MSTERLIQEVEIGKKEFVTDGYPMSVGEVANLYRDRELIIDPDFQRLFRWSIRQQSSFIESILLGIPIPSVFVYQNEAGAWELVDGVQRISTILSFVGELRDEEKIETLKAASILEGTKLLPSLQGANWNALPRPLQLEFKRAKIEVKIIKSQSDPNAKFEVFQRLNTGGSQLSDQELRNCVLVMTNKPFLKWLKELAVYEPFLDCLSLSDRLIIEEYHTELALRLFVFAHYEFIQHRVNEYIDDCLFPGGKASGSKKPILDKVKDGTFVLENEGAKFRKTFDVLKEAEGDKVFKKEGKGQFLESYFEAIAIGIYSNLDGNINSTSIRAKIANLENQADFTRFKGTGTNSTIRVPNVVAFGKKYFKP